MHAWFCVNMIAYVGWRIFTFFFSSSPTRPAADVETLRLTFPTFRSRQASWLVGMQRWMKMRTLDRSRSEEWPLQDMSDQPWWTSSRLQMCQESLRSVCYMSAFSVWHVNYHSVTCHLSQCATYLRTVLIVGFCVPLWSALRFHNLLI